MLYDKHVAARFQLTIKYPCSSGTLPNKTIKYRFVRGKVDASRQNKLELLTISSSGGIGRRVGLKIQSGAISVPVQVWPGAILKDLRNEVFFNVQTFLPVQLRHFVPTHTSSLGSFFACSFCKVWPGAILKDLRNGVFFIVQTFLPVQLRHFVPTHTSSLGSFFACSFCKVWPGAIFKDLRDGVFFNVPNYVITAI